MTKKILVSYPKSGQLYPRCIKFWTMWLIKTERWLFPKTQSKLRIQLDDILTNPRADKFALNVYNK